MFLITYSMSSSLPKNDLNRKNLSKVLQVGKVELESNKDWLATPLIIAAGLLC